MIEEIKTKIAAIPVSGFPNELSTLVATAETTCDKIEVLIESISHEAAEVIDDFLTRKRATDQIGGDAIGTILTRLFSIYNAVFLQSGLSSTLDLVSSVRTTPSASTILDITAVISSLEGYLTNLNTITTKTAEVDDLLRSYMLILQRSVSTSQLSSEDLSTGLAASDLLEALNPTLKATYEQGIEVKSQDLDFQESRELMIASLKASSGLTEKETTLSSEIVNLEVSLGS